MKFYSRRAQEKGFTLVEMIVSIGLFTVVAVVALGALMKTIDANKKSHTLKTVITNLNFVLESMSREIRVGTRYNCSSAPLTSVPLYPALLPAVPCSFRITGPWTITFQSAYTHPTLADSNIKCNLIYAYSFDGLNVNKSEQKDCEDATPAAYPVISNVGSGDTQDTVIVIEESSLKVLSGGLPVQNAQPYVQVYFRGYAGAVDKIKSTFEIQTTISQRLSEYN